MSRRANLVVVVSILAVLAGGLVSLVSLRDSPAGRIHRQAVAAHRRALRTAEPAALQRSVPVVAPRRPWSPSVRGEVGTLSIPVLGISGAPILAEGVSGGALEIPADVRDVGWDEQTPPPGRPGVTLVAGHVNWVGQGEGALGLIGQLVPGDRVVLDWRGHGSAWLVRRRPALSPNTTVHTGLFSDKGPPRLALVTCGGPFSETAQGGSYADNVIVEAVPAPASGH